MTTDDKICMARYLPRGGETHVCHEDRGHAGDHVCKSCGERWARIVDMPAPDPAAAAKDLGRAVGWREAIEALRGSGDQLLDHQRDGIHPCPCGRVRLGGSHTAHLAAVLADFLESLAPKETP